MSETVIKLENLELTKNNIIQLLEQLTIDYQNTFQERKQIALNFTPSEAEFTLLEEIELLTTDIRGYAIDAPPPKGRRILGSRTKLALTGFLQST